jgi:Uma2 family endonuclease
MGPVFWEREDRLPRVKFGCVADLDAIEIANPILVVEVLSPSTQSFAMPYKLSGYFSLPSIMHYLVVNPVKLPLVHLARQPD